MNDLRWNAGRNFVLLTCFIIAFLFTSCKDSDEGMCRSYYDTGELESEVDCSSWNQEYNGEMKMYHQNGKLKAIRNFTNGVEVDTSQYFYEDGITIERSIPMQEGIPDGEAFWYYENGNIRQKVDYQQGYMWGNYVSYNPDKTRKKEGTFYRDFKWGTWISYGENDMPYAMFDYQFDKIEGSFAVQNELGLPLVTGSFKSGLVDGEVKYFNNEGAIIKVENWVMGTNQDYKSIHNLKESYPEGEAEFYAGGKRIIIKGEEVTIQ